jgi:hypothetical protein
MRRAAPAQASARITASCCLAPSATAPAMSSRLHRKRTFDLRVDRYWTALGRHILEWHWRRFELRAADVTPTRAEVYGCSLFRAWGQSDSANVVTVCTAIIFSSSVGIT